MTRWRQTAAVAFWAALAMGLASCGAGNPQTAASTKTGVAAPPADVLPPDVNDAVVFPRPVSRLYPGMQVLVGEGTNTTVCAAGFYVGLPDPNDPSSRLTGFLTAAQCARGDGNAPVAVMKVEDAGMAPTQTRVGQMTYLTAGEMRLRVADEPWTIPSSPLAVFNSGPGGWVLPVDAAINGEPPAPELVQTAAAVQHDRVVAAWSGPDGLVASGQVLDPAATPELRDLPAGIERVVVAADDTSSPLGEQLLGAPATARVNGFTQTLGIIIGTDEARHWVVIDLISPFLGQQNAELLVGG